MLYPRAGLALLQGAVAGGLILALLAPEELEEDGDDGFAGVSVIVLNEPGS